MKLCDYTSMYQKLFKQIFILLIYAIISKLQLINININIITYRFTFNIKISHININII